MPEEKIYFTPYDLIDADPPDERDPIAAQMGPAVNGTFPMDVFVTNYANAKEAKPSTASSQPPVMGYFTAEQALVTDFFMVLPIVGPGESSPARLFHEYAAAAAPNNGIYSGK